MRVHTLSFVLFLLFSAVSICSADGRTFEVVGTGECADCKEHKFKPSQAFSGLKVTIDCKLKSGETKRVGSGELDELGRFKISLPQHIVVGNGQNLKEDCYAQLHDSSATPCPAHDGLEAAKITFKSKTDEKSTFAPAENLRFSSTLCASKFLWPYYKYPPLSKTHFLWKKKFPKIKFPPLKNFVPPFPPLYKPKPKPLPPPVPIYKPNPPVVKPKPPSVPIYKPKPPVVKPKPPSVPIYKPKPPVVKLKPPSIPIYKPKPPVYKLKPKPPVVAKPFPPPVPIYKPPIVTKPLPPKVPLFPLPPFYKKPCPPIPKIPKSYFHHPKLGFFPPLPPSIPQP